MAEENKKRDENLMEKIVSLCKRRGFVYPASDIYGGFANSFDFGPLGTLMKKNIKDEWWKRFVLMRQDVVGLDSAIIQNPKIWEASGHLNSFSDPLVECKKCHQRFRADKLDEAGNCSGGGEHDFTEAKDFNLMFKTFVGVTEDSVSTAYLRPETAQGIFADFNGILDSNRIKIPFGIAQIGKAFRNEITPGNFIFRTREFEQAEIEYFVEPNEEESEKWYRYWILEMKKFYIECGISEKNLSEREHEKDELSHYSSGTSDLEYNFPFGVSELCGIAKRSDYDLSQHEKVSGKELKYFDETSGKKFVPYVVEPSMGVDRAFLAFLVDGYDESDGEDGRAKGEITLHLNPKIAPIKAGVFPLMKKERLAEEAKKIFRKLAERGISAFYDESGSIGRRYRRQDEIGTPFCITVDFDSLTDFKVTVRERDSLKQERIDIENIENYVNSKIV